MLKLAATLGVFAAAATAAATAVHPAANAAAAPAPPQLPNLCSDALRHATFTVWDSPGGKCKTCRGIGNGSLVAGRQVPGHPACDGVRMESEAGMAASFYTKPFEIVPTAVYNVSWEARTDGLRATTAFLTGGVYAQFYDKRADFHGYHQMAALPCLCALAPRPPSLHLKDRRRHQALRRTRTATAGTRGLAPRRSRALVGCLRIAVWPSPHRQPPSKRARKPPRCLLNAAHGGVDH